MDSEHYPSPGRPGSSVSLVDSQDAENKRQTDSAKSRNTRWQFVNALAGKKRGTMTGRHVCRQNKRPLSADSQLDILDTPGKPVASSTEDTRCSQLGFYDLDFDNDDAEFEDQPLELQVTDRSLKIYMEACSLLRIPQCAYLSKHLRSTYLNLKQRGLGITGIKACAIALVTNTHVTGLDLSSNDIRNKGAQYVAEMLTENLYLSQLSLAENNITSDGLKALCNVLKKNRTIRKFDISGHGFTENDAVYIADLLKNNKIIDTLILHHNCFREKGGEILCEAIMNNNTLEVLDLSWNHLRRKGAIAIGEALERNTSIHTLLVSWNGFYQEGCNAIRKALCVNTSLHHLDMTCNRLSKDCMMILVEGLKRNTELQSLEISQNSITAAGANLLVDMLDQTQSSGLKYLNIESQCVDTKFVNCLEKIQESGRNLTIIHGLVFAHDDIQEEADMYLDEDPMMVLMEFMRQKNMRLVDLFTSLDADGSKSLTRDEFRDGLITVNIPLTSKSLDKLIDKLDQDGDGEVDFAELMEGQRDYKKKLMRLQKQSKEAPADIMGNPPENELTRIHNKIKKLLVFKKNVEKKAKEGDK